MFFLSNSILKGIIIKIIIHELYLLSINYSGLISSLNDLRNRTLDSMKFKLLIYHKTE